MIDLFIYLAAFIFVIVTLVLVHELGHYSVAKICGVKVEKFSIGMGKEIFGYTDKSGTRWMVSCIPLGGYVKMFGDASEVSNPDFNKLEKMSNQEKAQSFFYKNVWQKLAIVVAGPLSNYLFAIILFALMAYFSGVGRVSPIISQVVEKSPAQQAGLIVDDEIVKVNGSGIKDFSDLQEFMALHNTTDSFELEILRNGEEKKVTIHPQMREIIDPFGDKRSIPYIGVAASRFSFQKYGYWDSLTYGIEQSYSLSVTTLKALYQMITGKRSVREIGGPISIAKYSGKTVQMGFLAVVWFLALLSVNLGLMNLLPIPMLDGGHILFYLIEIITGKTMKKSIQEYGLRLGLLILGSLMIFATINDLVRVIWGN